MARLARLALWLFCSLAKPAGQPAGTTPIALADLACGRADLPASSKAARARRKPVEQTEANAIIRLQMSICISRPIRPPGSPCLPDQKRQAKRPKGKRARSESRPLPVEPGRLPVRFVATRGPPAEPAEPAGLRTGGGGKTEHLGGIWRASSGALLWPAEKMAGGVRAICVRFVSGGQESASNLPN